MYTVQQLSKMYNCTRQTIYTKLEHEAIQQYLHKEGKGLKLIPEGLSVLNTIISDSKIRQDIQQPYNDLDTKHTEKNKYFDMYVDSLKEQILDKDRQIEYLKLDKEKLLLLLVAPDAQPQEEKSNEIEELRQKVNELQEKLLNLQQPEEQIISAQTKKSLWNRLNIFKK